MADKEAFAFRLENDTADDLKRYVEERDLKKSDVLRRATKEYIDKQKTETPPTGTRSVSPLTILGVVAIAVAPTLLATGFTGLGVAFGAVGAVYALLWVTAYDLALERYLDDVRDQLDDAGGVVGFFRLMWFDHHGEDPDTIVERAARLDLYAPIAGGLGILVGGVAFGLYYVGHFATVAGVIGPWGVFGWALLVVGLAYVFALMIGVSAIASLAVASSRRGADAPDADVDPDA